MTLERLEYSTLKRHEDSAPFVVVSRRRAGCSTGCSTTSYRSAFSVGIFVAFSTLMVWCFWPHYVNTKVVAATWEHKVDLRERTTRYGSNWRESMPYDAFHVTCTRRQKGTRQCNRHACGTKSERYGLRLPPMQLHNELHQERQRRLDVPQDVLALQRLLQTARSRRTATTSARSTAIGANYAYYEWPHHPDRDQERRVPRRATPVADAQGDEETPTDGPQPNHCASGFANWTERTSGSTKRRAFPTAENTALAPSGNSRSTAPGW